ncbi:sporulation membrane protein YtaF [Clostridium sp. CX1]|uniref:sporulation membrane protein YtaF n=1 Tax=Clostridium sp. CX1 TaxID=2978346 RepID=UPI0021BF8B3E|nr:sporulation membrane protein YtaF [Clostridium sp. CX1]MCT8977139.1 sporulation membrane protein YtaF [Clostridium sp. CX1]
MHILSILLFALSSSSDNFIIGLGYGAKKIKINLISNLLVAFISCAGTVIAMLFGKLLCSFIVPKYANMSGSLILVFFGVFMLFNAFNRKPTESKELTSKSNSKISDYNKMIQHPEIVDKNDSKTIELKEAVILGIILCINNIGLGIGASITGLNIYITSLSSLLFSILFIKLGCHYGSLISHSKLSDYSENISAILIILLGIYELFI